ncbi:restriction endonuclease [Methylobacterium sp. C25]|uniref:restriction endonuclease n=1 Tax=Methylobacterium sp. C25 TaxID=2721622 RepID=UPI001F248D61|nr:restriction endonuclease [Methylobacterium sp. C25]MCE4222307.1 restriction endonuclease [Methylobacterium sp. C25]
MSARSKTVTHLFWTFVVGGAAALAYGRPALIATGLGIAAVLLYRLDRPRRFRALVRRTARRHARILALRRRQERFVDAYGNTVEDGWLREREYFIERTILPRLEQFGFSDYIDPRWDQMIAIVEAVAVSVQLPDETEMPEDGVAYERFCAGLLTQAGWHARPTQASGDQGADVIAEAAGTRLVVQCKRYGKPVGNAAVQEVAAAARHWSADMAAVVSNAGFTPAARKLAATTGVQLLHHDDLAGLRPMQSASRRLPA